MTDLEYALFYVDRFIVPANVKERTIEFVVLTLAKELRRLQTEQVI